MGNNAGVVAAGDVGIGHTPMSARGIEYFMPGRTGQPAIGKVRKSLDEVLVRTAERYLREAGIRIPYADIQVTERGEAVMYGVPNTGSMLVCARTESGIQNYL